MNSSSSDSFVPLCPKTSGTRERADFRVTVLRDDQLPQGFQPIVKPVAAPSHPLTSAAAAHTHDPQIALEREGDRVTGVRIHCTCGRVIELGFSY